ncbi:hypothetical protein FPD38_07265 [Campylobacter volucris]|uniref:Uncharacterized protein n=1 Tax=Campylobacter volucris TaxID=1031542 RepID=A0A5C7E0Q6_9BACT|nr:hypothetical protein [Campylobacter volucris]TXE85778.1 hypothetical protein FPD38_07265 [Campylobacter volucris]
MQVNHDNVSVREYGYSQNSNYKSTQGTSEDFTSLLHQKTNENLDGQNANFDEFFSKAISQDQFSSSGIYSSNMSNIYNYRFRAQNNEIPSQANTQTATKDDSKDIVKDLLNSL